MKDYIYAVVGYGVCCLLPPDSFNQVMWGLAVTCLSVFVPSAKGIFQL
jgi:hypothetical protein